MPVRLNGSTSGYVDLAAPAVAGTTTLTLPTTSGTLGLAKVLQTVGGKDTNVVAKANITSGFQSIESSSFSITPTSASSKILVLYTVNCSVGNSGNNGNNGFLQIIRGSTNLTNLYTADLGTGGGSWALNASFVHLDSPATTSSVSYFVRLFNQSAISTTTIQIYSVDVVLMEVAA